jgi:hypothetical protein
MNPMACAAGIAFCFTVTGVARLCRRAVLAVSVFMVVPSTPGLVRVRRDCAGSRSLLKV